MPESQRSDDGVQIDMISAERMDGLRTMEKIRLILDSVHDGNIVILEKGLDPDEESNPLMRPAFRQLDRGQATALIDLWSGFEDREALGRWVRNLSAPTNGEKPEGLLDAIVGSPPLLAALLDQREQEAKVTRYRFAVAVVMPSFLTAARTLNGGERTDSSGATHGAFNS